MSKLGSALGKKYEENRLSVLTRSFELGDHTFKVRVPSVQEIEAIYNYFKNPNKEKVDFEYQYFLKIQQLYILQWTEFERFAYFSCPQANSFFRGNSIFKNINSKGLSNYFDFALKNDTIYNIKDLKDHNKLNEDKKLEFSYYNSLRNTIVH